MKKKLLSLVLAGAMVASTSVSAFATTPDTQQVTTDEGTANVTIDGSVDSNTGQQAAGTISVSIPTSLQFQVNTSGDVNGSGINVVNNGLDKVQIIADQFTDNTPSGSITVDAPNDFERSAKKRSNVVLWVQGNGERAYFKSGTDNGIYNVKGQNEQNGITVSTLSGKNGGSNSDEIRLNGYAGTDTLEGNSAITDQFTLRLKVKKVTQ
ncbi:hypothetical protein [Clostridium disporicum]|uniref:hypothetical protein n=1 Tax=Clostridium disporicum TaxID=84024 RepID=UPI00321B3BD1